MQALDHTQEKYMTHLSKATRPTPQAPVITIAGLPGTGKTTLAATFPRPIFIQAENARTVFEQMDGDDQPMFFPELPKPNKERNIRTSVTIIEQLRELVTEEHDRKTVVIDTATSLNALFESEVVAFDPSGAATIGAAAGSYQGGYNVAAAMHAEIRFACESLRRRGITVIFLAHTAIVKMKNRPDAGSDYTVFTLDMHEKSRAIYINHSDAVIFLKTEEFIQGAETDKKGRQTKFGRVMSTGDRIAITAGSGNIGYIDAKNRYGMPTEMRVPYGENPLLPYFKFYQQAKEVN
jgi:DNA polymerase III delta prime subunit